MRTSVGIEHQCDHLNPRKEQTWRRVSVGRWVWRRGIVTDGERRILRARGSAAGATCRVLSHSTLGSGHVLCLSVAFWLVDKIISVCFCASFCLLVMFGKECAVEQCGVSGTFTFPGTCFRTETFSRQQLPSYWWSKVGRWCLRIVFLWDADVWGVCRERDFLG